MVWFRGGKPMSHKRRIPHLLSVHNLTVLTGGHVQLGVVMCEGKLALTHPAKGNVTPTLKTIIFFSITGLDY